MSDPFEEAERLIIESSKHCSDNADALIADLPEIVVTALRLLLSDYDRPKLTRVEVRVEALNAPARPVTLVAFKRCR